MESAGPEIERLEKERDAAEGDAASAVARMAALTEIAEALPDRSRRRLPVAAARAAGARVAAAETVVREADEARAACEAELARVASLHGNREQFRSFANLVETHERHVTEVERTQTAVDGRVGRSSTRRRGGRRSPYRRRVRRRRGLTSRTRR